jgi:nucleoside-diphosphate-sugar epimerase
MYDSEPLIGTEAQLEDFLSTPNARDIDAMGRITGDVIVLGAGGKMGPSLTRRIKRAAEAAMTRRRVIAVSRFSSAQARAELESMGVETISCDLLDRDQIEKLPVCENALFLAGRKFGSSERPDLTWANNTIVPADVARHFRAARIVAFSTGNVYPLVHPKMGGSVETDAPDPRGEYAQSCLGRERVFEYFSQEYGTKSLIFRLNYAVDLRYGVLVDIARIVFEGRPIDLAAANFNVIWQGDANSFALRCLEVCSSPPRILNVTGPETVSTRRAAHFFADRFQRAAVFQGEETELALLNNASLCHKLLGYPEITLGKLMEMVAHWVENGGVSLNKPTRFEVTDGRF